MSLRRRNFASSLISLWSPHFSARHNPRPFCNSSQSQRTSVHPFCGSEQPPNFFVPRGRNDKDNSLTRRSRAAADSRPKRLALICSQALPARCQKAATSCSKISANGRRDRDRLIKPKLLGKTHLARRKSLPRVFLCSCRRGRTKVLSAGLARRSVPSSGLLRRPDTC